jgi:hypothetical protein
VKIDMVAVVGGVVLAVRTGTVWILGVGTVREGTR